MINIDNVTKNYGDIRSLDAVTAAIGDGSIYGLIGSNGSGKSTLLRVMSGIFTSDTGSVSYDGEQVWENCAVKLGIIYLSDEQYFLPHCTIEDMMNLYRTMYPTFNLKKYERLCEIFNLDPRRKINTFSKGMKKQASLLLALAACPRYLLCDETFDGLDPVMRQLAKRLIADDVAATRMTPIIASHNLSELEDICDHIGLLHKGGILFESELDSLKLGMHTIQAIFNTGEGSAIKNEAITNETFAPLKPISFNRRGSMVTVVVRSTHDEIHAFMKPLSSSFYEIIPLTLDEIFICEMEERGYDYSKLII